MPATSIRNPQSAIRNRSRPPFVDVGSCDKPVPARWRGEVERVLIPADRIARRMRAMARCIEADYRGRDLVLVALLNGTVMFLADLVRCLNLPLKLDFLGVSSYRNGMVSGELVSSGKLKVNICGRHVIIVDDIMDTGKTMSHVISMLQADSPRSIRICTLLDKPSRRTEPVKPDYAGFVVPDCFVVGYGLDFAERYRNLPFVGVLRESVYKTVKRGGK